VSQKIPHEEGVCASLASIRADRVAQVVYPDILDLCSNPDLFPDNAHLAVSIPLAWALRAQPRTIFDRAQNDVADLRCSPASAASSRDATRLKLFCNTFVRVNTSCTNLCDRRRKGSRARIGLGNDRLSSSRTSLACKPTLHERQMSLNGSGLIAV
jgi:hypothetical protein